MSAITKLFEKFGKGVSNLIPPDFEWPHWGYYAAPFAVTFIVMFILMVFFLFNFIKEGGFTIKRDNKECNDKAIVACKDDPDYNTCMNNYKKYNCSKKYLGLVYGTIFCSALIVAAAVGSGVYKYMTCIGAPRLCAITTGVGFAFGG